MDSLHIVILDSASTIKIVSLDPFSIETLESSSNNTEVHSISTLKTEADGKSYLVVSYWN